MNNSIYAKRYTLNETVIRSDLSSVASAKEEAKNLNQIINEMAISTPFFSFYSLIFTLLMP